MCQVVDDPWYPSGYDEKATLGTADIGVCSECRRDLQGQQHVYGSWGPMRTRHCADYPCHQDGCDEYCGAPEEYIADDEGREMRFCPQCLAARKWLERVCSTWMYEGVLADLESHFEDAPYPVSSFPLGRLVVGMRNKWRRRDGTLWNVATVQNWADQASVKALTPLFAYDSWDETNDDC